MVDIAGTSCRRFGRIRECQMDAVLYVRDVRPRRVVSAGQTCVMCCVQVVLPLRQYGDVAMQQL